MHEHHHHHHDHDHEHCHEHHHHDHDHCHEHDHHHDHCHDHDHHHEHGCSCGSCGCGCEHNPMEEMVALMKYMVSHNAAHAKELADLAIQLQKAGSPSAYEQVMAAVSDFEKGNMRLSMVLAALDIH